MDWRTLAHTFPAFEHWGSLERCAAIAHAVTADVQTERSLTAVPLEALRTALFMAARAEHRSGKWVESTPVEDAIFAELLQRQGEPWIEAQLQPPADARARRHRGRRPPLCPACGSGGAAPIVYGEPDPRTAERAERGELWIGGCCCYGDGRDPDWKCMECGNEFWSRQQQERR